MTTAPDERWQDWLDGELGDEESATLAEDLADPAAAGRAVDQYQLHRLLGLTHADDHERFVRDTLSRLPSGGRKFSEEVMARIDRGAPRGYGWLRPAGWAAAAVLLLTLGAGTWFALQPPPEPVATLVAGENARWQGLSPAAGQRLRPGAYRLTAGRALLHCDGGAQIALVAPVAVTLVDRAIVTLATGTVAARLDAGSAGFTLRTGVTEVVDRGTEFVVISGAEGTDVHVIAGAVACVRAHTPTTTLTAGNALRLRSTADAGEAIPLTSDDFDRLLPTTLARAAMDGLEVYEGFTYPPTGGMPLDGGRGWAAAWTRGVPGLDAEPITLRSLGLGNDPGTTTGRALRLDGEHQTMLKRTLAVPLVTAHDSTRYLSFLYRLERPSDTPREDALRVTLAAHDDRERLTIGIQHDGRPYLSGGLPTAAALESARTYRIVLRLTTATTGEAHAALLVLPVDQPIDAEPTQWTAESAPHLSAPLGTLEIAYASGSAAVIDELRLTPSWAAAVPTGH